jgi:hypothetical protein
MGAGAGDEGGDGVTNGPGVTKGVLVGWMTVDDDGAGTGTKLVEVIVEDTAEDDDEAIMLEVETID